MLNIPRNCQLSEQIKQEMTPKRKENFFINVFRFSLQIDCSLNVEDIFKLHLVFNDILNSCFWQYQAQQISKALRELNKQTNKKLKSCS